MNLSLSVMPMVQGTTKGRYPELGFFFDLPTLHDAASFTVSTTHEGALLVLDRNSSAVALMSVIGAPQLSLSLYPATNSSRGCWDAKGRLCPAIFLIRESSVVGHEHDREKSDEEDVGQYLRHEGSTVCHETEGTDTDSV